MWLHIINNDKFVYGIINMFEKALPGEHIYGFRPKNGFVVPEKGILVSNINEFKKLLESRSDWKGVIFNPLAPECWNWLSIIPNNLEIIWFRWGYEAYEQWILLKIYYGFQYKTKKWALREIPPLKRLTNNLRLIVKSIDGRRQLRRVNVFVGSEDEEYILFRKVGLLSSKTRYHFGSVGLLSSYVSTETNLPNNLGNDILLGNSASPTNNHIEAIDYFSEQKLEGRKVIVPLSYGEPLYRDMIYKYGKSKLGNNFEAITEFMPLNEYQVLLNRCGFVMMNHLRQQAVGNIVMMLMKGAKVFTNNTTIYRSYKKWGINIFLIKNSIFSDYIYPLSEEQIIVNQSILYDRLGDKRIISELRGILLKQEH